ncbi:hypothetical protein PBRA_003758 [Plasmodiophora brassicae]|uniref:Imelysin-like domain-containing protein n=1 Tax=Plasmodiophora brassicae TaxID=37360 RepID=A0A0G4IIL6_PLABS|nr:hypothetical protein PBRA_003758 [Plasmodiophora brassicae]
MSRRPIHAFMSLLIVLYFPVNAQAADKVTCARKINLLLKDPDFDSSDCQRAVDAALSKDGNNNDVFSDDEQRAWLTKIYTHEMKYLLKDPDFDPSDCQRAVNAALSKDGNNSGVFSDDEQRAWLTKIYTHEMKYLLKDPVFVSSDCQRAVDVALSKDGNNNDVFSDDEQRAWLTKIYTHEMKYLLKDPIYTHEMKYLLKDPVFDSSDCQRGVDAALSKDGNHNGVFSEDEQRVWLTKIYTHEIKYLLRLSTFDDSDLVQAVNAVLSKDANNGYVFTEAEQCSWLQQINTHAIRPQSKAGRLDIMSALSSNLAISAQAAKMMVHMQYQPLKRVLGDAEERLNSVDQDAQGGSRATFRTQLSDSITKLRAALRKLEDKMHDLGATPDDYNFLL